MEPNPNEFGELLQQLLGAAGRKKAFLAKATGISPSLIGYYVSGRSVPRPQHLARIAQALGVQGDSKRSLYQTAGYADPTQPIEILDRLRQLFSDDTLSRATLQAAAIHLTEELRASLGEDEPNGKVAACVGRLERTLTRFDREAGSRVKWVILPAAGWQAECLAPQVTTRLVAAAVHEAAEAGLTHFVVVVAPTQQPFLARELGKIPGVQIRVVLQKEALGFGHAVSTARDEIPDKGPVAVLTADELADPSCLKRMLQIYEEEQVPVVAVREWTEETPLDYGRVSFSDGEGDNFAVSRIVEKPDEPEPDLKWILLGRYVLSPACLESLSSTPRNRKTKKIELTDSIRRMLASGDRVRAHVFQGDLKSFSSPMREVKEMLDRIKPLSLNRQK